MINRFNDDNQIKALEYILSGGAQTLEELAIINRKAAKKFRVDVARNSELLSMYRSMIRAGKLKQDDAFERLLRRRAIRTLSGIAPVAVLTKPFACPGKCAYCPTEKDVPQSYLSNEPAVMRAIRCEYHPYVQVVDRLRSLENNGHQPTKIELIVIGGTWSVLPEHYKYWYIVNCFKAANDFGKKNAKVSEEIKLDSLKSMLLLEQKRNENAKYKLIGITLETRPDYINEDELLQMRTFGCTRVELGVQAIDDDILKLNKRGHGVKTIADATALLRNFGFKVTYHLMPGLPGSTPKKDLDMFINLFNDERFQPDQIKFYPTVVTKGSLLYRWWLKGEYKPYTDIQLQKLIIDCKRLVPAYVRIIRLIRDIPGESIIAGNKITNLRQILQQAGVTCGCIRCREAKDQKIVEYKQRVVGYNASGGQEYFIEYCSLDEKILYAFCRLRIIKTVSSGITSNRAIIRELHVYGELVSIGATKKVQHSGLGTLLIAEAEKLAIKSGCEKMSIISGVGVRGYYLKFGYKLFKTYMIKSLK